MSNSPCWSAAEKYLDTRAIQAAIERSHTSTSTAKRVASDYDMITNTITSIVLPITNQSIERRAFIPSVSSIRSC